jgi:zinc protease
MRRRAQVDPGWKLPPVERMEGANYLSLTSPQEELPIVAMRVLLPSGSWDDPPGKEGLNFLTAQLLQQGTRKRGAEEIHRNIDSLGGRFHIDANFDYTMVGMTVLSEDLSEALDLLVEILREPAFPEEEFLKRKRRLLGQIASQKDRPGGIARAAFLEALWGKGGYGHDPKGLEESVQSLEVEDVVDHYRRKLCQGPSIWTACGDVKPEKWWEMLREAMEGWGGPPSEGESRGEDLPSRGRILASDRKIPQATVLMGQRSIGAKHPDLFHFLVMNYILGGGGFGSRLMDRIRSKKGMAYSAFSRLEALLRGGIFVCGFQTENSNVREAMAICQEEAERIRVEPVTSRELDEAKGFLMGSFPMKIDSMGSFATNLALWEFYGLGLEYPFRFTSTVAKATVESVMETAREHLDPGSWVCVVVGDLERTNIEAERI